MPHLHTKPGQHDLTTTAFIIRLTDEEPLGLVHVHRKLGLLLPAGGHVELGENPWAASIHEIEEETGYEIKQLQVLQPRERIKKMDNVKTHPVPLFLQTHEYKRGSEHYHIDVGFAFMTNQTPAKLPADGETTELVWLNQQQLHDRRAEMPTDICQIYNFIFDVAVKKWERISPYEFDV